MNTAINGLREKIAGKQKEVKFFLIFDCRYWIEVMAET